MSTHKNLMTVCFAAVFALGLAACSSSSDDPPPDDTTMTEPEPTAYEKALAAIQAAETAEAAQEAYDAVDQTAISGDEAQKLQAALTSRQNMLAMAMRKAEQKKALMDAAGMIDTSDLSTAEAIAAANTAIAELQKALDDAADVSDDDKAMYQSQLDTAKDEVATAQTGLDRGVRMMVQRDAINDAAKMAQTAVAGVDDDSTDSEVSAAEAAVQKVKDAIDAAEDLAEDDAAIVRAQGVLAAIEPQLAAAKSSRKTAKDDAAAEMKKTMAATGKALHAALGPPAVDDTTALDNIAQPILDAATGLAVDAAAGAGSLPNTGDGSNPGSVTLEAGDSAGSLDGWAGTSYAHTNAGTKVVNEAVVYTNRGPGATVSFAKRGNNLADANEGTAPAFTAIKGSLTVVTTGTIHSAAHITRVMADAFTHSGTQNHALNGDTGIFTTRGTYDGAPGVYRCTGECSSTNANGKGSPSALGGTWHFKPDAGANAKAHAPDATYLYYGWWVSKDKDGGPTAASAFTGIVGDGTSIQGGTTSLATNPNTLGGSATYAGHAAGKFAMSNALDGTGSGGHFTADATLTAKFGAIAAPTTVASPAPLTTSG